MFFTMKELESFESAENYYSFIVIMMIMLVVLSSYILIMFDIGGNVAKVTNISVWTQEKTSTASIPT